MKILAGVHSSFLLSKPKATVVPPNGAGCESVAVNVAGVWPSLIEFVFTAMLIVAEGNTVTVAVASAKPTALARIVVVPIPTAVTLKPTTWPEALMNALEGTKATEGLDDDKLKLILFWALPESASVRVASAPGPLKLMIAGESEDVMPTVTKVEAGARPGAVTVIVAVPAATPVRLAPRLGAVWPALMLTPVVLSDAVAGSLLES